MPTMPTRDDLAPRTPQPNQTVIGLPDTGVASTLGQIGRDLGDIGALAGKIALEDKRETDVSELAKARAIWAEGLTTEGSTYTLDQRPNHGEWAKEYDSFVPKLEARALDAITDGKLKERFRNEIRPDIATHRVKVMTKAREVGHQERRANMEVALDGMLNAAVVEELAPQEAGEFLRGIGVTLKQAVETGLYSPAEAAKKNLTIRRTYATVRATQEVTKSPERAYYQLSGRAARDLYEAKISRRESNGRMIRNQSDPTGTSTAFGPYQITQPTWKELMKRHPEAGLTLEGFKNSRTQHKAAFRLFTDISERTLKNAKIPITEANLRVLHFMGWKGGLKLLKADGSAEAAKVFKTEAKSNPTIFREGRSVTDVIKVLTKGFAGDYGKGPGYLKDLPAASRIQLTEQAHKAAASLFGEAEKEAEIAQAQQDVDAAMVSEDGVAFLKALPPGRRDMASKLYDQEMRRKEEAKRNDEVEQFKAAHAAVRKLIADRDFAGARKAIPDGMPQAGKDKLERMISAGADVPDELARQQKLNEWNAMRLRDPAAFMAITPAQFADHLGTVKDDDIILMQKRQEEMSKGGKARSVQSLADHVNAQLREIGVKVGASAEAADQRRANAIRSTIQVKIDAEVARLGRDLKATEERDIVADAFLEASRPSTWWDQLFSYDKKVKISVADLADMYAKVGDPELTMESAAAALQKEGKEVSPQMLYRVLEEYKRRKANE